MCEEIIFKSASFISEIKNTFYIDLKCIFLKILSHNLSELQELKVWSLTVIDDSIQVLMRLHTKQSILCVAWFHNIVLTVLPLASAANDRISPTSYVPSAIICD